MSIMNFLEAIDFVLESEMELQDGLMILRPGARRALDESDREIALPRLGETSFSIALGAALTGMHPVLDLRQEEDALSFLIDALVEAPSGVVPDITIIMDETDADGLLEFPDLRIFHPKNPRQAAGLLRSALRAGGLTLFIADLDLSDLTDDVPDDPDFMLLPLDDVCEEQETETESPSEEYAPDELPVEAEHKAEDTDGEAAEYAPEEESLPEPSEIPAQALPEHSRICAAPVWAMRQMPVSLDRLNALETELDAPFGLLEKRCMERLENQDLFCWQQDFSALPGECAFLPPTDKAACLWLGRDVLSITYNAGQLPHEAASALLRAARRLLENPALLIFDKECDLP